MDLRDPVVPFDHEDLMPSAVEPLEDEVQSDAVTQTKRARKGHFDPWRISQIL
jgi:hypothetical protein